MRLDEVEPLLSASNWEAIPLECTQSPKQGDRTERIKMKTKAEGAWDATKEKAMEFKEKAEDKIEEWKGDDKAKPQDTPLK